MLLGALHVVRDVEALGALDRRSASTLSCVDLGLEVELVRRLLRAAQDLEERLADLVVGLLDERGDLAVVVLAAALSLRLPGSR